VYSLPKINTPIRGVRVNISDILINVTASLVKAGFTTDRVMDSRFTAN